MMHFWAGVLEAELNSALETGLSKDSEKCITNSLKAEKYALYPLH